MSFYPLLALIDTFSHTWEFITGPRWNNAHIGIWAISWITSFMALHFPDGFSPALDCFYSQIQATAEILGASERSLIPCNDMVEVVLTALCRFCANTVVLQELQLRFLPSIQWKWKTKLKESLIHHHCPLWSSKRKRVQGGFLGFRDRRPSLVKSSEDFQSFFIVWE